jgi:hypothetical protein
MNKLYNNPSALSSHSEQRNPQSVTPDDGLRFPIDKDNQFQLGSLLFTLYLDDPENRYVEVQKIPKIPQGGVDIRGQSMGNLLRPDRYAFATDLISQWLDPNTPLVFWPEKNAVTFEVNVPKIKELSNTIEAVAQSKPLHVVFQHEHADVKRVAQMLDHNQINAHFVRKD